MSWWQSVIDWVRVVLAPPVKLSGPPPTYPVSVKGVASPTKLPGYVPSTAALKGIWSPPPNLVLKRGELNKNPGNIDYSPHLPYRGLIGLEPVWSSHTYTPRFSRFQTHEDGIHAMAECLLAYYLHHNIRSIEQDVNRWAPPSDGNFVSSYILAMTTVTGFKMDAPLDFKDLDTLSLLIAGHIRVEQGRIIYPAKLINDVVAEALWSVGGIGGHKLGLDMVAKRVTDHANLPLVA